MLLEGWGLRENEGGRGLPCVGGIQFPPVPSRPSGGAVSNAGRRGVLECRFHVNMADPEFHLRTGFRLQRFSQDSVALGFL